jgi:hypothetical protein
MMKGEPGRVVPSLVAPEARIQNVGEGQGGGDCRTLKVGNAPTPSPSPQGGGGSGRARDGGSAA